MKDEEGDDEDHEDEVGSAASQPIARHAQETVTVATPHSTSWPWRSVSRRRAGAGPARIPWSVPSWSRTAASWAADTITVQGNLTQKFLRSSKQGHAPWRDALCHARTLLPPPQTNPPLRPGSGSIRYTTGGGGDD